MATMGKINIDLGDDAKALFEFFIGTRVAFCSALTCKYQRKYIEEEPFSVGCSLKQVDINDEGKCNTYEHI